MKFWVHVQGVPNPIEIERQVQPGNLLAALDDVARRGFVADDGYYYPGRRVRYIKIVDGEEVPCGSVDPTDVLRLVARDASFVRVTWAFDEQQADPIHHQSNLSGRFLKALRALLSEGRS